MADFLQKVSEAFENGYPILDWLVTFKVRAASLIEKELVTFKVTTFYKSSKINTFFHVKKSVQKFRSFFLKQKEPKTDG